MKKLFVAAVVAVMCVFSVAAQELADFTLSTTTVHFPEGWTLGSWYDSTWDATWTFENNDIKLTKNDELIQSFKDVVQNYNVKVDVSEGITVSFDCPYTNRSYAFTKPVSLSTDLVMKIDRKDVPESDKNCHWTKTLTKK